ncbi:MAG: YebC/PmpR family DNA-binding transcriptional regulator [Gemmatimonadales bacterium]
MAGHSKWKQIKHKKAITDAKRAQVWTKAIREITVAARVGGGGDPDGNPRLRTAIEAARAVNMPKDNIDRAIKKGTGELEGAKYEEVVYEGYGPGGAAIYIEASTDNTNRTVAEIRHAFSRNGGSLAAPNAVAWMFDRCGQIYLDAGSYDEEATLEAALEAGAEDFQADGDAYVITTSSAKFHTVLEKLKTQGLSVTEAELAMVPQNTLAVSGKDAEQLLRLLDAVEALEDVSKVFSNFDMDTSTIAEVAT